MDKIVLGHNLDDQVETVTMNFIRGSGLTGISGISPESSDIIHPILSIKRDEIVEYLK
ncbi:MAG: tRNA(Ile)-lysidine synthetase, partial [Caldiserica bacterium]